MFRKY